ncbi:hypothetical protein LGN04_09010 [Burkholderia multivorans]|nr:hypothetical protein [Burkholderia multivorans]MCA8454055.1 hypothetical protein [Burkholderia multivorans]MCA8483885.1 hypothetical protein [Burkholderia multivorans]MDN7868520.1 hypothetical protein [Burkholderia multivorans]
MALPHQFQTGRHWTTDFDTPTIVTEKYSRGRAAPCRQRCEKRYLHNHQAISRDHELSPSIRIPKSRLRRCMASMKRIVCVVSCRPMSVPRHASFTPSRAGGRRPSFVRGHSAAFDREHGRELGKPGCAPFLEKSVEWPL